MRNVPDTARYHVEEALKLVNELGGSKRRRTKPKTRNVVESLKKTVSLLEVANAFADEPIRTVHHLSCTGGTMIAKCIAAMPNVTLLNEIDFHSPIMSPSPSGPVLFTPTDVVSLIKQAEMREADDLISDIFLSDISLIRKHEWLHGRHLVLRDHTHSQFLTGDKIADRATMKEQLSAEFPTLSIVTVRNPIDSWLSMLANRWHEQFSPPVFDEYCRRYNSFLDHYDEEQIVRYEDFVSDPPGVVKKICQTLNLGYFDQFEEVFQTYNFSGDSGRKTGGIRPRPRRENPEFDIQAAVSAPEYRILADRLGYAEDSSE